MEAQYAPRASSSGNTMERCGNKKRQVLNLQRYRCTMVRATSLAVLGSPLLHSDWWHAQSLPRPGPISFQRPHHYRQACKPRRPPAQHRPRQTNQPKRVRHWWTLLKSGGSTSSLNRLRLLILKKLLEKCGKDDALDPKKRQITKMDIVQVLLVSDMFNRKWARPNTLLTRQGQRLLPNPTHGYR